MACQQDGSEQYDYASVPILVTDYLDAPTQWVMANGNGGKISFISTKTRSHLCTIYGISGFLGFLNSYD